METELTFEYLLQYFLIAHSKNFPKNFNLENKRIKISLLNYVASQLHLNAISSFYSKAERDIYQYNTAYNFLKGAKKGRDDTLKVLNFLFQDTYLYLMKSPDTYYVNLEIDQEKLNIHLDWGNLEQIKKRLISFIKTALGTEKNNLEMPTEWHTISTLSEEEFLEISNDKAFEKFMETLSIEQIGIEDVVSRIDNYVQAINFMRLENDMQVLIGSREKNENRI